MIWTFWKQIETPCSSHRSDRAFRDEREEQNCRLQVEQKNSENEYQRKTFVGFRDIMSRDHHHSTRINITAEYVLEMFYYVYRVDGRGGMLKNSRRRLF